LHPGEIVGVSGPNGAGKSTLLKILSGEWKPAMGDVRLDGTSLLGWDHKERARRIAVLPQISLLHAPFTGLQVTMIGRTPHSTGPRDREIALAALAKVDAAHLAERVYPLLSGGEQQRVQLARVLAQIWEPPCRGNRFLLLDEPTANLDLPQQHRSLEVARGMAGEGAGILAIMHDLNLASRHADRIMLMRGGQVVALGPPGEVVTRGFVEATFDCAVGIFPHPQLGIPLVFPQR
jgi:iron complex transport system ATP-binding protein